MNTAKHRFTQLHLLTFYPASNLNRDDSGRPKTVQVGNATRLRISSQSLKRAWRTSDIFEEIMKGHIGCRTRSMGKVVSEKLKKGGLDEKKAAKYAGMIAEKFGKLKKNSLEIEQLAHFTPQEEQNIKNLIQELIDSQKEPDKEDLNLLAKNNSAADAAMFGRMLAGDPKFNAEAAVQVAHAFTVNKVQVEEDFFTAVDDLNSGDSSKFGDFFAAVDELNDTESESAGAGHMGVTEFGAGVFYVYICVDRRLLLENLGDDIELFNKNMEALIKCAAQVAPTGKQNSFASRARASYILAENGNQQPRSLAAAFLKPVKADEDKSQIEQAVEHMNKLRSDMDEAYGDCSDEKEEMIVGEKGKTLAGIISLAQEN